MKVSMSHENSFWIRKAVDRHESQLIRYTQRITGDLEQAREVVQEAFLKLWQEDRARVEGHLLEWLYTVCRNHALDLKRKGRRMVNLPDGKLPDRADDAPTAGERLEQRETENRALDAFCSLNDKQQEVLRLKFQGGLSYAEISRVTGLSVSNVGYIIHTGIQLIRSRLAPEAALEGVPNES
jgi:RNA polymerase sigma-70 factor (ECF subfamily)